MSASRTPPITEVLDNVMSGAMSGVRVAMPGKVVRFDGATGQCDAQPCVKVTRTLEDGTTMTETLPVVPSVPIMYPSGGGFCVTFPLTVGDYVLLVFSDQSLDKFLSTGGVVDPEDGRNHDLTDAIAIPGLHSFKAPLASVGACLQAGQDGGTFEFAAMGGADYDAFMTALKTHTHAVSGGVATASTDLTSKTLPVSSTTVKVST